ncbi:MULTISPECIES: hypothetical protein [unclassified Bradyrhizobium]
MRLKDIVVETIHETGLEEFFAAISIMMFVGGIGLMYGIWAGAI